jgi:hypothetical protein
VCVRCAVFVMTNEKRKKTRNTYYFYYVENSRSPLKIIKFSHSLFCHCSARAKLFKKRHLTTLHAGQTACRTIYPCALADMCSIVMLLCLAADIASDGCCFCSSTAAATTTVFGCSCHPCFCCCPRPSTVCSCLCHCTLQFLPPPSLMADCRIA